MSIEEPSPDRAASLVLQRRAARYFRISLGIAGGGVIFLALVMGWSLRESIGVAFFALFLPGVAVAQVPLLGDGALERIPVYLGSAVAISTLGALGLGMGVWMGGTTMIGLTFPGFADLAIWTGVLTVGGLALIGATLPFDRGDRWGANEFMRQLLPRTGRERRVFVGLSVAAGFGEELAYRGYLLAALQVGGLGPWMAAVLSSVAFGVLHAYQGPIGVARTMLVGMLMAISVLLSGSLLGAIVAHTIIDLVGGLVLGPRWMDGSKRNLSGIFEVCYGWRKANVPSTGDSDDPPV